MTKDQKEQASSDVSRPRQWQQCAGTVVVRPFLFLQCKGDDPSRSGTLCVKVLFVQLALLERSASERQRLRRGTAWIVSEKEEQRVYCLVKEESESPQSRNFR